MAISPPNWISYAYPSTQGWRDPRTNELLKSQAIPQADINEYTGWMPEGSRPAAPPPPPPEPVVEMLTEAPSIKSLWDMSKRELEDLGRQHGIELDRRQNKTSLVEELESAGIST